MKHILYCTLVVLLGMQFSFSQTILDDLKTNIKYLSSDELEGRRAGERGNNTTANYIAEQFKKYNLETVTSDKSYFQPFEIVTGVKTGEGTSCVATVGHQIVEFIADSMFRPLGFSEDGTVSSEVVFAGYGISSEKLQYDDYANLDVKGKIVVVLRFSPPADSANRREFERLSSFRNKARVAREKGAAAIIFVTGPIDEEVPKLLKLRYDNEEGSAGIIVLKLTWTALDSIFISNEKSLRDVQMEINESKKPASFVLPNTTMNITVHLNKIKAKTQNVIGLLRSNEETNQEYIVIGAHFDHLGYGGEGSGSTKPDTIAIHNGADDNASGTSGMLALARMFSENRKKIHRNIIFMGFTGEEMGLLGSAYYSRNPIIPLEKTVGMVNLDMIGRLKDKTLTVYGTGTSPVFDSLLNVFNTDSMFVLKKTKDGYGPSDQTSFYVKDIPVLFFFTDLHEDYHKPSDDWEKINFEGEEQVIRYVYNIANALQSTPAKPQFTRVDAPQQGQMEGDRRGNRASLGVVPAFGEEIKGAKITGTRPGSAAEKAGLQKDDIIIRLAGKDILNLVDLTNLLADHNPGDEVEIVVLRGTEQVTLKAVLGKR